MLQHFIIINEGENTMKEIALILLLMLIYVPILSLRLILMVRSKNIIASFIGFLEAMIYVSILSIVLRGAQTTLTMIVYAAGFGSGIYIGGYIEQRLAIGHIIFKINLKNKNEELMNQLRNKDFSFTIIEGEGKDGKRYCLDILTNRRREEELLKLIETYEPESFIVTYEPRKFKRRTSLIFK